MDIVWDGITQSVTLDDEAVEERQALADAAKGAAWSRVFALLSERERWVNSTRLGGPALYAPLHQAAWHGAPVEVAERLISLGAWRTHQNADGAPLPDEWE